MCAVSYFTGIKGSYFKVRLPLAIALRTLESPDWVIMDSPNWVIVGFALPQVEVVEVKIGEVNYKVALALEAEKGSNSSVFS